MNDKLKRMFADYGAVAIGTYLGIFALALAGFAGAIGLGVQVESAAGGAGTFAAAYVATKLTQPLRILATALLTPLVARLLRRKSVGP